jgi:hypothetical protein
MHLITTLHISGGDIAGESAAIDGSSDGEYDNAFEIASSKKRGHNRPNCARGKKPKLHESDISQEERSKMPTC